MSDSLYTPDELLIVALRNKRDTTEALRLLTQEGADINAQNIRGETPLFMMSTIPGGQAAVEWLLANGADPNIAARTGDTPLMAAVKQNNPTMVSTLLAGSANPNIANNRGVVPLLEAVLIPADKDHGLVRLFLEAAGLVPRSDEKVANPVKPAAVIDTAPALKNLMAQLDHLRPIPIFPSQDGTPYAPPDYSYEALHDGNEISTALSSFMSGVGAGAGLQQMMLKIGGKAPSNSKMHPSLISRPVHMDPVPGMNLNLDPRTDTQTTPLLAAVTRGQEQIVRLLMNAGADAEAADHLGQGILYAAVLANNPNIMQTIVSVAPWLNPNAAATSGTTPIAHAAVIGSKPELVHQLLDIGGDPNARSRNRMAGVGTLLQGVCFQIEDGLPSIKARREIMKEAQKNKASDLKEKKKLHQAALDANAAGNDMAAFAQLKAQAQAAQNQGQGPGAGPLGQSGAPIFGAPVGTAASGFGAPAAPAASAGGPDWEALQDNPYWNGTEDISLPPEMEKIDMDEIFAALKAKRDNKNGAQLKLIETIIEKGGDPSVRTANGQLSAPLGATWVGAAEAMAILAKHMKKGLDRPYDISCLTALDMFASADLDQKDPESLVLMNNLIDLGVPVQRPHWDEAIDGPIPPLEGRDAPKPRRSLPIHLYQAGWWDGLMCLLDRGGDVNEPDPLGVTLAHEIVAGGSALPESVQKALALMARQIAQKGGNPETDEEYQMAKQDVAKEHRVQMDLQRNKLNDFKINWAAATRSGVTPLHVAVRGGDMPWVDYLLEQPMVDPNAADEKGNSSVSLALSHGDIRLFNKLMKATIARNLPDPTGDALLKAIQNASDDFREREPLRRTITLLGAMARLDRKASHMDIMTPVVEAVQAHQAIVQSISDARQMAREAAKERAVIIKTAQKEAIQKAKENNLSPEDTRDEVFKAGEAAKDALSRDIETRLKAGEKIPGVTLIEIEAERHAVELAPITTRLDKIDTSVTYRDPAQDMESPTALVLAPLNLIGHLIDPAPGSFIKKAQEARTEDGHSALILAAALGQHDIVRILLQEGFNPNASDKDGNTALMQAVFNEDGEVIRLMRAGGAKRDQQNAAGQTAADVAIYIKSVYVQNALEGGDLSGPLQDVIPQEPTDTFQHDAWRSQLLQDLDNGLLTEEERRLAIHVPWSQQVQALNESLEKEESMRKVMGQTKVSEQAGSDATENTQRVDENEVNDDGDFVVDVSGFRDNGPTKAVPAATPAKKDLLGLDEVDESLGPMAKATRSKRAPKSSTRTP